MPNTVFLELAAIGYPYRTVKVSTGGLDTITPGRLGRRGRLSLIFLVSSPLVYEVMMGEWRPGLHLPTRVAHGRPFRPFFSYPEQSHVKYSRAKPFFSIVSTPGYPLPGEPESNVASLADKVSPVLGHKRPGPPSVADFIGYTSHLNSLVHIRRLDSATV